MDFELKTDYTLKDGFITICLLTNEQPKVDKAEMYLSEYYESWEDCSLVEENNISLAEKYGYKYCVVFEELDI